MTSFDLSLSSIGSIFQPVFTFIKSMFEAVSIAGVPLLTVLFGAFFLILFFKFIFGSQTSKLNISIRRRHKGGED